jgi:DNA-binding SARP family transcriptional activator
LGSRSATGGPRHAVHRYFPAPPRPQPGAGDPSGPKIRWLSDRSRPHAVDLHRFRALVARARASQKDEERAALLEEGLALWQGEPFADLNNPWLTNLRASLNREKLDAMLDRNDIQLWLGLHTVLLADLSVSSAAHPLDERLAAQFMLALYRSGRQADALNHYLRTRRQLDDELGVDPGPEMQDLYQRILRNAPELSRTRTAPVPARPLVPRQLPAHTCQRTPKNDPLRFRGGFQGSSQHGDCDRSGS